MPDDNRLDLNTDLDEIAKDLLKDVEAATKQVKQRRAADKEKDRRNAANSKDKKTSIIIIASATVILIVLAIWLTFGRGPAAVTPQQVVQPQQNPVMNRRGANRQAPQAPPRPAPRSQQVDQQPYGDDQPGQ